MVFPQSVEVHNSWSGSGSQLNSIDEIIDSLYNNIRTLPWLLQFWRKAFLPLRVIQPHSISNSQLTFCGINVVVHFYAITG